MKKLLFYSLFLIVFGLGVAFTLQQGRKLSAETGFRPNATHPASLAGVGPSASLLANLRENFQDPLTWLFVQVIALNIGYDLGILSPRIFAMLVLMALVTTCMTGPLLTFADYLRGRKSLVASPT